MKYHLNWLLNRINREPRVKYIFFWGHQPRKDGRISESCFSQWSSDSFEVEGIKYPSAEHYMMAEKARLFGDVDALLNILACQTPAEAKKLGRAVQHFVPEEWNAVCYDIVVRENLHKFSQNQLIKGFLLQTGDRVLVEASPLDTIWGIGLSKDNPVVENPRNWRGKNMLGFALMEVRDQLR